MSSYETAVVRVKEVAAKIAPQMKMKVQPPYFDAPDYIAALVASAEDYLEDGYDHLLFSFHGIPERHLQKSDPTGCHCLATENCCEVPARRTRPVTARNVSRPSRLRRKGGRADGKIFGFVPVAARQRPVVETLHGF